MTPSSRPMAARLIRQSRPLRRRLASWLFTPPAPHQAPFDPLRETGWSLTRMAPLRLAVDPAAPATVTILAPGFDAAVSFGGMLSVTQLARELAADGAHVRLAVTAGGIDGGDLAHSLGDIPVIDARDRAKPFPVSPRDPFIATWWETAHIAQHAVTELGQSRFAYLIQDYEPLFYRGGSQAALAEQTYAFPHLPIFATELLEGFFAQRRIGAFADESRAPTEVLSFRNPIADAPPPDPAELAARTPHRLLFYARPQGDRNLFELGIVALREAIASGSLPASWEFTGIGAIEPIPPVDLGGGATLTILPRTELAAYRAMLRDFDIGLSLMYSPHPSLPPLDMASAGMLVVTTTYANKTADVLRAITPNLIGVPPTIAGIMAGLGEARSRLGDAEARAAGARFTWPRRGDRLLAPEMLARLRLELEEATRRV